MDRADSPGPEAPDGSDTAVEPGLPAAAVENVREAVDGASSVAIVGAPWSGRGVLIDRAAAADTGRGAPRRVTLDGPVDTPPDVPETGHLLVTDCHHLYRRAIDGFEPLESFIRDVARTDATVVTSWNRTAWSYLTATTAIERAVDTAVEIPPLGPEDAVALLRETTGVDDPEAMLEAHGEDPVAGTPLERLQVRVRELYRGTVVDRVEALVADAAGNPRAIRALFDCRTGRADRSQPGEPDVGYEGSYLLWLALSNEGLAVAELADRVDVPVEPLLASLARQGAVTVDGDDVWVPPVAFGDVHTHLNRRRLLW